MLPPSQYDGRQSAGPSSFVSRLRTNFKNFTKATRPKQHAQGERSTGTTQGPTTPAPQGPETSQPLSITRPRLPHLHLPKYKRWSATSVETCLHAHGGYDPSPTTLVGSPDSWSWGSDSEWALVNLPTTPDGAPRRPSSPRTAVEHEGEGRDAEVMSNHRANGSDYPGIVALPTTPSPHHSRPPSPVSYTIQDLLLLSPSTTYAQPTWPSGLPEDVWHLVAEELGQCDLAQLAGVCRDTRYAADRFLQHNPVIRTAQGVVSWAGALAAQPTRRPLVRSLTIGWEGANIVEDDADEAYSQIMNMLRGSRRLRSMTLFADAPRGRFASKRSLPRGVRTLKASAAVVLNLSTPLPPLLHLSVNVLAQDLYPLLDAISSFGETLLQLRLFITWRTPFVKSRDNPARWCVMRTPRLAYFEIREERTENSVPLYITSSRCDWVPVRSFWPSVLAEKVPSLRCLVWQPVWGTGEGDMLPGGAFYDVVRAYRSNLFALLKLDVVAFALPDGQYSCHEAGKRDPRAGRPVAGPEDLWKFMRRPELGPRKVQLL